MATVCWSLPSAVHLPAGREAASTSTSLPASCRAQAVCGGGVVCWVVLPAPSCSWHSGQWHPGAWPLTPQPFPSSTLPAQSRPRATTWGGGCPRSGDGGTLWAAEEREAVKTGGTWVCLSVSRSEGRYSLVVKDTSGWSEYPLPLSPLRSNVCVCVNMSISVTCVRVRIQE